MLTPVCGLIGAKIPWLIVPMLCCWGSSASGVHGHVHHAGSVLRMIVGAITSAIGSLCLMSSSRSSFGSEIGSIQYQPKLFALICRRTFVRSVAPG